ncbi:MAG: CsbD family protein [Terracidiphilus sp.]|nr:CsbD family protein [Terracidiphilus sp.]
MKSSTENVVEGKIHEAKGKVKEAVGRATNNPNLEGKGIGEKVAGTIQNKLGHAQKVIEKP